MIKMCDKNRAASGHTGKAGLDPWAGPMGLTHGLGPWAGPMGWAGLMDSGLLQVNIRSVPTNSCLCLRSSQYLTCGVCFLCKVIS